MSLTHDELCIRIHPYTLPFNVLSRGLAVRFKSLLCPVKGSRPCHLADGEIVETIQLHIFFFYGKKMTNRPCRTGLGPHCRLAEHVTNRVTTTLASSFATSDEARSRGCEVAATFMVAINRVKGLGGYVFSF